MRGGGQEMQQPTKPDRTTKNYTTGHDDETQCIDETRRNTTAASNTMESRDNETHEGKQGRDAARQRNNQPNKAGVVRCARGRDAMTRQDKTRQRDDETTCRDDEM
jgi:hypothetical protein